MMSFIRNLTVLTFKEVKSVASDVIMMIFMIYLCTVAVVMAAQNITTEVRNASVAITDHDGSTISRKIAAAIVPPYFRKPDLISDSEIQAAMDLGSTPSSSTFRLISRRTARGGSIPASC